MPSRYNPKVYVYEDEESLARAAAEMIQEITVGALRERKRVLVAISGGSTPRRFFRLLSTSTYAHRLPWEYCHFFWCDERLVPADHPESNFGQAFEMLFSKVAIPRQNLHRIRGELTPSRAAEEYRKELEYYGEGDRKWPRFDLVFLGLGSDGHTASLFPGVIHPEEKVSTVIAVTAEYQERPTGRVSLTPLVFNSARKLVFLVSGKDKARAVSETLKSRTNPEKWPAQRIQPHNGKLIWMLDKAAFSVQDPGPKVRKRLNNTSK